MNYLKKILNLNRNRLCNICTYAEIGDEFHYILQCNVLANERKLYLSQYFSRRINTLKFGQLFQNKNKPKLTKLYKFIRVLQYHTSPPGQPHICISVLQYHTSPPGQPHISVIKTKLCYFICVIIIQFCRPSSLVMCI